VTFLDSFLSEYWQRRPDNRQRFVSEPCQQSRQPLLEEKLVSAQNLRTAALAVKPEKPQLGVPLLALVC